MNATYLIIAMIVLVLIVLFVMVKLRGPRRVFKNDKEYADWYIPQRNAGKNPNLWVKGHLDKDDLEVYDDPDEIR